MSVLPATRRRRYPTEAQVGEAVVAPETLTTWINKLLDHCYLAFGGEIWRQIVGIPMRSVLRPRLTMLAKLLPRASELQFMQHSTTS